ARRLPGMARGVAIEELEQRLAMHGPMLATLAAARPTSARRGRHVAPARGPLEAGRLVGSLAERPVERRRLQIRRALDHLAHDPVGARLVRPHPEVAVGVLRDL